MLRCNNTLIKSQLLLWENFYIRQQLIFRIFFSVNNFSFIVSALFHFIAISRRLLLPLFSRIVSANSLMISLSASKNNEIINFKLDGVFISIFSSSFITISVTVIIYAGADRVLLIHQQNGLE